MLRTTPVVILVVFFTFALAAIGDEADPTAPTWQLQTHPQGFVWVLGDVGRPGDYVLPQDSPLTLKQLIASVGLISGEPGTAVIEVRRPVDTTHMNYLRITYEMLMDQNTADIELAPNDSVNVFHVKGE